MVEFQFKPTDLTNPDWTSIFHMTAGDNIGNIGDRIPAVFFKPSNGMAFRSALNTRHDFAIDFPPPTIGKWTKIRMSQELQNQGLKFKIFIDEVEKLVAENSAGLTFDNVRVFAADPWYPAQPGSIKNLSINVKAE